MNIACGGLYCLTVDTDGKVWAFGDSGGRRELKLSNEDDFDPYKYLEKSSISYFMGPSIVPNLENISMVSCGEFHSFCVSDIGKVWGFGNCRFLNDELPKCGPTLIEELPPIISLDCGYHHSIFVDESKHVWGLGKNSKGELGLGHTTNIITASLIHGIEDIIKVSCGCDFTSFLTTDGNIYFCGSNAFGQLGFTELTSINSTPILNKELQSIFDIACGKSHTLVLTIEGEVYSFGSNDRYQLGTEYPPKKGIQRVPIDNKSPIISVAAGDYHSFAIEASGDFWIFGYNNAKQLGGGDSLIKVPSLSKQYPFTTSKIVCGPSSSIVQGEKGLCIYGEIGHAKYMNVFLRQYPHIVQSNLQSKQKSARFK